MPRCVLVVDFYLKPGAWDELNTILTEHARLTLAEETGCHQFDVLHPETPSGEIDQERIMLIEIYQDRDALAVHRENPRMVAVGNAITELCTRRERATSDLV